MSIRSKLIITFLIVAIISAVASLVTVVIGRNLVLDFKDLVNEEVPTLIALSQLNGTASRIREEATAASLLLAEGQTDPDAFVLVKDDVEEEIEEFAEFDSIAQQALYDYSTQTSGADEILTGLTQSLDQTYRASLALITLKQEGASGEEIIELRELVEETENDFDFWYAQAIESELADTESAILLNVQRADNFLYFTLGAAVLSNLIAIFLAIYTARTIANPIEKVTAVSQRIGEGDLDARVYLGDRKDEIGVLATETNRMAANLNQQIAITQQANEANEFKSNLIARVSHELRTPLGAMLGLTEVLHYEALDPLTDQQKNVTGRIVDNMHYLEKMVNELLDQSQLETNSLQLNLSDFSPEEKLGEIADVLLPLAKKKQLSISVDIDKDLPQTVHNDADNLGKIVANLLGNAIKFTDEGSVTLKAYPLGQEQWGFEVRDTGPGIPDEAHDLIFEAFRQVDEGATRSKSGSGLGLAIANQLVQLMNGEIMVANNAFGQGTVFTVILPNDVSIKHPDKMMLGVN